ncbi:SPOR domain-containing protein [Rhodoferax sp. UBA5149]|uniref:SPOR domain-containing protein n=1 Tax=Rhodoferax sp. UBA5149 TaxID=1947379 RepID=UPI0025DEBBCF|nr:SPOR domain-containing protein [Rhodoferax sp. UBA5149]
MKQQRGGTILGLIIGVVIGLGAALAVAVYVTKVPVPFVNRGQSRTVDQDAAESKKNKDWDPNAPLYGKNPVKPSAAAATDPTAGASAPTTKLPSDGTARKTEVKPAVSADPLGDLAKARAAGATSEPFSYFVQVGAFRTPEDAESQRAKLSLSGVEAKVTEREQSGRTVFRVRVGPFDKKDDADKAKEKLDAAGLETALVRVQR